MTAKHAHTERETDIPEGKKKNKHEPGEIKYELAQQQKQQQIRSYQNKCRKNESD